MERFVLLSNFHFSSPQTTRYTTAQQSTSRYLEQYDVPKLMTQMVNYLVQNKAPNPKVFLVCFSYLT